MEEEEKEEEEERGEKKDGVSFLSFSVLSHSIVSIDIYFAVNQVQLSTEHSVNPFS